MARPTLMKLALVIALTIAAGTAHATGTVISATTPVGAASFAPSNNVQIGVAADDTNYSANSKHLNGDRVIGFVSTDSKLYYSTGSGVTVGSTTANPSTSTQYSTLSATGSGWNSM